VTSTFGVSDGWSPRHRRTLATAKSVLGVILVEERLHVAVLVGLNRWLGERAVLALLLLQLGQRFLRALEHGAGQLVLVDGVVARRQDPLHGREDVAQVGWCVGVAKDDAGLVDAEGWDAGLRLPQFRNRLARDHA
jgi:hypothetical protein